MGFQYFILNNTKVTYMLHRRVVGSHIWETGTSLFILKELSRNKGYRYYSKTQKDGKQLNENILVIIRCDIPGNDLKKSMYLVN